MAIVRRRTNLMLLLVVASVTLFSLVDALKCYCAEFIDGIQAPGDNSHICGINGDSCETDTGVCYHNLMLDDDNHIIQTYNCIEDIHGVSSIHITCELPPPDIRQVIECCDEPDFCNRELNLTLPTEPPSETLSTQSPTASNITPLSSDNQDDNQDDSQGGLSTTALVGIIGGSLVCVEITIMTITFVLVCCYLYKRKIKNEYMTQLQQHHESYM